MRDTSDPRRSFFPIDRAFNWVFRHGGWTRAFCILYQLPSRCLRITSAYVANNGALCTVEIYNATRATSSVRDFPGKCATISQTVWSIECVLYRISTEGHMDGCRASMLPIRQWKLDYNFTIIRLSMKYFDVAFYSRCVEHAFVT